MRIEESILYLKVINESGMLVKRSTPDMFARIFVHCMYMKVQLKLAIIKRLERRHFLYTILSSDRPE